MWSNFHTHSTYCDGKSSMEEHIAKARELKVSHLGFSSHAPLPFKGLEKIFHNDFKAAFTRYFELTREMISTSCPSIVGHLDKMKIQNNGNRFFNESESWYQQEIRKYSHHHQFRCTPCR
jgi:histidinol phosphatase-like PHP family hydrolase